MARPKKDGLDYFPFDVGFFSDKKIKRLRAKYGNDGIVVYIYALCLIYRDYGYYAEYDEDLVLDISDELNISESSTRQIMKYLLSRSLLCEIRDSKLAKPVTIISAESVQRRFQEAKKYCKRDVFVKAGYWLLEKAETLGFVKVRPENEFSEKNSGISRKNVNKSEIYATKERKGNKRKLKEREETAQPSPAAPTPAEVGAYVLEKGYRFKPERFINYYAAKEWKIHGDAITDWRRLCDNWGLRESDSDTEQKSNASFDVDDLSDLGMFND